ncbi:MAG TPA: chemotaxis protein CheW, partial [Thermoanaerobaculia bacterium]
AAGAVTAETRTIVVEDSGSLAGFTVDRVLRVVKVRPEQVQPHPVVSPTEQNDAVRGVFQSGTSLTIVLDVEKLLARG